MIANRKAVKTSLRRLYRSCRVREGGALRARAAPDPGRARPEGRSDPCIALLTPGVWNSAFYEHMFLAREIGAALVEGRGSAGRGRLRLHAHGPGAAARGRDLPPGGRRLPRSPRLPSGLPARRARTAARLQARARGPGERAGDGDRRRQERLRLRARHDPLLPGRGAAPGQRGDPPLPAPGGSGVHPRQPGEPGGQARGRIRGVRDAGRSPRDARGTRGLCGGAARRTPPTSSPSRCSRSRAAPCLVEGRAEPRHVDLRPFVLHAARPGSCPARSAAWRCAGAASW